MNAHDQFIQVGNRAFNLANLRCINFTAGERRNEVWLIYYAGDEETERLLDAEANAFREWWDAHANVYVINVSEQAPPAGE